MRCMGELTRVLALHKPGQRGSWGWGCPDGRSELRVSPAHRSDVRVSNAARPSAPSAPTERAPVIHEDKQVNSPQSMK